MYRVNSSKLLHHPRAHAWPVVYLYTCVCTYSDGITLYAVIFEMAVDRFHVVYAHNDPSLDTHTHRKVCMHVWHAMYGGELSSDS